MPWHLSRSDPRKVYDERHGTVGVCQTPEQAALIVDAVNRLRANEANIELRERASSFPASNEAAKPEVMHSFTEDGCCGPGLRKAARSGTLDAVLSWTCTKCGCDWESEQVGPIRHWTPRPLLAVIR